MYVYIFTGYIFTRYVYIFTGHILPYMNLSPPWRSGCAVPHRGMVTRKVRPLSLIHLLIKDQMRPRADELKTGKIVEESIGKKSAT